MKIIRERLGVVFWTLTQAQPLKLQRPWRGGTKIRPLLRGGGATEEITKIRKL
jgi:hypothetical protein